MKHLLKSDFYKLRKARYFWVCLVLNLVLAAGTVFLLDFTYKMNGDTLAAQMEEQQHNMEETGVNISMDGIPASYEELSASNQLISFFTGNTTLIIAVLISLFVGSEFNYGTMKNIASKNYSRNKIYLSKLIAGVITAICFTLLFALTATLTAAALWGFGDVSSGFWGEAFASIGLELLLCSAYVSVFVMFSMLVRQNGGSLAANICFLEFISLAVMLGEVIIKKVLDKTVTLSNYLIDTNMNAIMSGLDKTIVIRSLCVGIVFFAAATLIGMHDFCRRDIR